MISLNEIIKESFYLERTIKKYKKKGFTIYADKFSCNHLISFERYEIIECLLNEKITFNYNPNKHGHSISFMNFLIKKKIYKISKNNIKKVYKNYKDVFDYDMFGDHDGEIYIHAYKIVSKQQCKFKNKYFKGYKKN